MDTRQRVPTRATGPGYNQPSTLNPQPSTAAGGRYFSSTIHNVTAAMASNAAIKNITM